MSADEPVVGHQDPTPERPQNANLVRTPKGQRVGGRQKGTPNKLTQDMREVIYEAFEQLGGVEYLVTVGRQDPKTFCTLLAKIVPAKVDIEAKMAWEVFVGNALAKVESEDGE